MGAAAQTVSVMVVTWMHQFIFTVLLVLWPETRTCAATEQFDTSLQSSPAVQSRANTTWGENPLQKVHLHYCDWKQPGAFVGQSFPKFTNIGGCSQASPRAAPACRVTELLFLLCQDLLLPLTHRCFFTETGVSDTCYDDIYAMCWWSSTFLD